MSSQGLFMHKNTYSVYMCVHPVGFFQVIPYSVFKADLTIS